MNKLKSTFITIHWLLALNFAFSAASHWLEDGRIAWWGAVIVGFGFVLKPLLLRLGVLSRDDARASVATGIALLGLAFALLTDTDRGAPLAWSFAAAVNVFIHTYWSTTISHGRRLGNDLEVAAKATGGPQLMVFLRGNWCSYSLAARRGLEAFCERYVPESVPVTVVSDSDPQAEAFSLSLRGGMPFGLHWFNGRDALCPGIVLIGKEGDLAYVELAASLREPLTLDSPAPRLLKALKQLA
ncbi:MAG: hypothetical protein K6L73_11525 [Cellvibrionaceae bacterium]